MNPLASLADDPVIGPWLPELTATVEARLDAIHHENRKGRALADIVSRLPAIRASSMDLDTDRVRIGVSADMVSNQRDALKKTLESLKPWRKGPFEIFGIDIETEWNSAIKWQRVADHLPDQSGRRVLDIGASNGYYMFRMAAHQPDWVIGIEPYLNYYFQFVALSRYLRIPQLVCLPLKMEELPVMRRCFDTVFCMGILYHRRSPVDTLNQIHRMMVPGGTLVVETLIIEGDSAIALFPEKRYARMNNIFFIPTVTCLTHWLARCGFERIRCVDISATTLAEQHKTDWIDSQSLNDFLDPNDPGKTIEGYPAPVRAMVLATPLPR